MHVYFFRFTATKVQKYKKYYFKHIILSNLSTPQNE